MAKRDKQAGAAVRDVGVGDLTPDPRNARLHNERNIGTIAASLTEVGAGRSVVIDENGVVLAGNATLKAAKEAGIERVRIVDTDGRTLVAVRRTGLSDAQKVRLALTDNRSAELAEGWDAEVLRTLAADGVDFDGLWSEQELLELLGRGDSEMARTDPDSIPAERSTDIRVGDVYELGPHRLLCGDSTQPENITRLSSGNRVAAVLEDPPYAIYGSSTGVSTAVADDRMVRPFFEAVMKAIDAVLEPFGHAYVFCDWRSWSAMFDAVRAAQLTASNMIVWDKGDFGLGSHYRNNHELIAFLQRLPRQASHFAKRQTGQRPVRKPNVIRMNRTGQGGFESENEPGVRYHNAAKPVNLCTEFIANSSSPGDRVADLFLGAGSTLIAAETLGRACIGAEIEPRNCQIIIDRWEAFTGKTAAKVGEVAPV